MGVSGFWKYLRQNYYEALVADFKLKNAEADFLFIDLHSLVHSCLSDGDRMLERTLAQRCIDVISDLDQILKHPNGIKSCTRA